MTTPNCFGRVCHNWPWPEAAARASEDGLRGPARCGQTDPSGDRVRTAAPAAPGEARRLRARGGSAPGQADGWAGEGAAPTTAGGSRGARLGQAARGGLWPQPGPSRPARTDRLTAARPNGATWRRLSVRAATPRPPRRALEAPPLTAIPLAGSPARPPGTRPAPPLADAHRAEADPAG